LAAHTSAVVGPLLCDSANKAGGPRVIPRYSMIERVHIHLDRAPWGTTSTFCSQDLAFTRRITLLDREQSSPRRPTARLLAIPWNSLSLISVFARLRCGRAWAPTCVFTCQRPHLGRAVRHSPQLRGRLLRPSNSSTLAEAVFVAPPEHMLGAGALYC